MTKLNDDAIPHLARAMIFRRQMKDSPPAMHMRELRNRIIIGPVSPDQIAVARNMAQALMTVRQGDMPADPDDLALLIDCIAMRYGMTSRADAWRKIGINPNRGRDLFARNSSAIDWPIWFTARAYALC